MTTDAAFRDWLARCDAAMILRVGMDTSDLPDWTWRDAFDDGLTPAEAINGYWEEYADF